jgi:hypothetical protein
MTACGPAAGGRVQGPPAAALRLPVLLGPTLYRRADVCAHARRAFPDRPLVLVALKSHVCDRESQVCLRMTRDLADPCNALVQTRFALYHARLYRNTRDAHHVMEETPGTWDIIDEWGGSGPTLFVIDPRTCVVLGEVPPGAGGHAGPADPTPRIERLRRMAAQLLALPGVRAALGEAPAALSRCRAPEASLDAVLDALESQRAP